MSRTCLSEQDLGAPSLISAHLDHLRSPGTSDVFASDVCTCRLGFTQLINCVLDYVILRFGRVTGKYGHRIWPFAFIFTRLRQKLHPAFSSSINLLRFRCSTLGSFLNLILRRLGGISKLRHCRLWVLSPFCRVWALQVIVILITTINMTTIVIIVLGTVIDSVSFYQQDFFS